MSDPLSLSVSFMAVLQTAQVIIAWLKDVHDAPQDRLEILTELSGLRDLLLALHRRVQSAGCGDPWLIEVQALGVEGGHLDRLDSNLRRLASKLETSESTLRNLGRRLLWRFNKVEVKETISRIERMKTICLSALANDTLALTQAIKTESSDMKDSVAKIQAGIVKVSMNQTDDEFQKIVDWLSPLSFRLSQSEAFQKWEHGTGQWFLDSKAFRDWRDGTAEILWCPGMPGSGKTVITSIVMKHLEAFFKSSDTVIACIYCNYTEHMEQTAPNLIASVLKQIVQASGTIPETVKSLYRLHATHRTRPTLDEFMEVLKLEIGKFSRSFVVIDALDECSEANGTRKNLLWALRSIPGNFNVMVTSRDLPSIAGEFEGTNRLEIRADDHDVRRYINGRISRSSRRHLRRLQDIIIEKVVKNAGGMFLLAQLHFDSLEGKHNIASVRSALETLPGEIDDTYDEAMVRIKRQTRDDVELAHMVLSWVTYAYRPLSIRELQHALAVTPHAKAMDVERITDEEYLTSVCAGLVVIDEERSIIHLVHYTTQQYFERKREFLFPKAQARITETGLTYLLFDVFGQGYCHSDSELNALLEENPLLDYAAHHWGDHARPGQEETCQSLAMELLQDESKLSCANQVLLINSRFQYSGYSQRFPKKFSGLHMLSFFGLEQTMVHILQNGVRADLKDDYGRTPLSWAARNGHVEAVKLLAAREDVDINSKDKHGLTPLSLSAENGHVGVVRVLESMDKIMADSRDFKNGQTPLSLAARNGHEEVVRLLVQRDDVEVDGKDSMYSQTPLSWAAENGHARVVDLLLSHEKVNVNSKDRKYGQTPLSRAAKSGRDEVVKLLAARDDVDVNSRDNMYGQTPLSWAAESGHVQVSSLLMMRGDIEVESKDNAGRTPLSWAAGNGHDPIVNLFLPREDIELNSRDKYSRTPLSWASKNGHEAVIRLLMAQDDLEADPQDCDGQTPISLAAREGHESVVRLLAARDDVAADSKDTCRRTPLSWAAEGGHAQVVELLLAQEDVSADYMDVFKRNPLFWAAMNGHAEVVKLLVTRGDVEVNTRDAYELTPLSWGLEKGYKEVVRLLVGAGAR